MTNSINSSLRLLDIEKATMNIPEFLTPWIDRFYDPLEIDLLQILKNRPLEKKSVIKLLIKNKVLKAFNDFDQFLERARIRGVVKILDDKSIALEDFHIRFEYWALFEGWKDLPSEIKDKLNNWELNNYIKSHAQYAEGLKKGLQRVSSKIYPEYFLLEEVEALFEIIPKFYLWPCNCRAMIGNCRQSEFTCIRFSNDRDIGWEISKEKALIIVNEANKKGLMQSAELRLDEKGEITGALCNCCNDCCFPHQLSERLNVNKYWPVSRYVVLPPTNDCNKCGKCVRRCPFGLISQEKHTTKKQFRVPVIDIEQCRGCGICATGCPQDAIKFEQIKESPFEKFFKA